MKIYRARPLMAASCILSLLLTYIVMRGHSPAELKSVQLWYGMTTFFLYNLIALALIFSSLALALRRVKAMKRNADGMEPHERGLTVFQAIVFAMLALYACLAFFTNDIYIASISMQPALPVVIASFAERSLAIVGGFISLALYVRNRGEAALALFLLCIGAIMIGMEAGLVGHFPLNSRFGFDPFPA